jgi:hypothetical protein
MTPPNNQVKRMAVNRKRLRSFLGILFSGSPNRGYINALQKFSNKTNAYIVLEYFLAHLSHQYNRFLSYGKKDSNPFIRSSEK